MATAPPASRSNGIRDAGRTVRERVRADRRLAWALAALALGVAILLPYLFPPASPFVDHCVTALAYVVMALGLNIVVGFAGLLDLGYVAFFAIGAYSAGWVASAFFASVNSGKGIHILTGSFASHAPPGGTVREPRPGDPLQLHPRPGHRRDPHRARGRSDRPADAAPARRLH